MCSANLTDADADVDADADAAALRECSPVQLKHRATDWRWALVCVQWASGRLSGSQVCFLLYIFILLHLDVVTCLLLLLFFFCPSTATQMNLSALYVSVKAGQFVCFLVGPSRKNVDNNNYEELLKCTQPHLFIIIISGSDSKLHYNRAASKECCRASLEE